MATATIGAPPVEATHPSRESHLGSRVPPSSSGRLLRVVAIAFAIRMVVVAFTFRGLADPARHFERFGSEVGWVARAIALHHGFSSPFYPMTGPTALVPPLYTFLLAGIFKVFGIYSLKSAITILTLDSLFSALTGIPIYLAARLSIDTRAATFAVWAWAIYPFAIYFSAARVWEFSLTSLLIATCFWLALRLPIQPQTGRPLASLSKWLGFGALFGLAGLSNPAAFALFPVLILLPLWKLRRTPRYSLRSGLLASAGLLIVLTPWTVRNYRVLHILCPVRDSFWYELWSANNGDGSNPTLEWTHPASNPVEMDLYESQGETAYIAQKRTIVTHFLVQHPGFFVKLTVRRAINYWTGFWSLDPSYTRQEPTQIPNVFFCTSLTLLMLFGARDWWRRDPSAAIAYLIPIAIFPVAYYISHPLMDYRQPIEPQIVILVVVGLRAIKHRLESRSLDESAIAIRRTILGQTGQLYPAHTPSFAELATPIPSPEPSATLS